MVDRLRVKALLDRIVAETTALRRFSGQGLEALQPDLIYAVKYRFVVAIEAAIDVSRHLAASRGLRMPADYADSFVVLGEAGLLEPDLVERLKEMARFRNVLVHQYADVDDVRVVTILDTRLGELDQFCRQVAAASA